MIEQHVVSLELSKQLSEAGVAVESEYRWIHTEAGWQLMSQMEVLHIFEITFEDLDMGAQHNGEDFENYPAPLSSELGDVLPENDVFMPRKYTDGWGGILPDFSIVKATTEADARAKVLLYLADKGQLK